MALFTLEELEELRRADEELESSFTQTQDEIDESRRRDRMARLSNLDNKERKLAEYQKAYYEANREKYNAYMRSYLAKRRAMKKEAAFV